MTIIKKNTVLVKVYMYTYRRKHVRGSVLRGDCGHIIIITIMLFVIIL